MTPTPGDILTLEITKLVHGGWGLARSDGFVVFVSGVLPGELVRAEVRESKKSHAFGDVVEVIDASEHRVPHIWPEASWTVPPRRRPGGADYGHIDLDHQRILKAQVLHGELAHHAPESESVWSGVEVSAVSGESDGRHWRTRETLHVGEDGRAGPRGLRSHDVIPVDTLPLAVSAIEDLGVHRQTWEGHRTLRMVAPSGSAPRLIIDRQSPQEITEWVGERAFRLSDQSFWQVHTHAAATLCDAVNRAVDPAAVRMGAWHLDLYGGVGLFAACLSDRLGHDQFVVSVESEESASRYAAINLADLPRARADHADTFRWLRDQVSAEAGSSGRFAGGVILMDPPRQGAGEKVVDQVAALLPSQVVYVACDPVALARDTAHLAKRGYELASVHAFDLFPHTHHMECVARFDRKA